MPVSDAEDVHGDRVSAAGHQEVLQHLLHVAAVPGVALQPAQDQVLLEGAGRLVHPDGEVARHVAAALRHLDPAHRLRLLH